MAPAREGTEPSGRTRLSDERISALLDQSHRGVPASRLCAEAGISRATFFRIKARYGGPARLRRILDLERDVRRARREGRQLLSDLHALQGLLRTRLPSLEERYEALQLLTARHGLSERRACELLDLHRSTVRYRQERVGSGLPGEGAP